MIDLTDCQPFARGGNRDCYRHPEQPDRCLKLVRTEALEARRKRQPRYKRWRPNHAMDDNQQEHRAYQQLLRDHPECDTLWHHLPRFYGQADTSLGLANVCELILSADNTPAPTLEALITADPLHPTLVDAIRQFQQWLRQHQVMTRNLLPHNLVVGGQDEQLRLVLIDGLGAAWAQQQLAQLPGGRRRYIERRIIKMNRRLHWEQQGRPGRWEEAEQRPLPHE
ncbi:MAG: PhoP regulatory network YrbL family protein [Marinobacter sp.]|nr:PhoP regulatory network YrbL family protein [Marinobacter sp.]